MKINILDMSSLKFQHDEEANILKVLTSSNVELTTLLVPANEAYSVLAFLGLDAVAAKAVMVVDGEYVKVALYNPYTAEISLGASDAALVFTSAKPFIIDANGLLADIASDGLSLLTTSAITLHKRADITIDTFTGANV